MKINLTRETMSHCEQNSNMTYKGRPIQKIFSVKDYHLSNNSIAMFAAHMCDSMDQGLDFASCSPMYATYKQRHIKFSK